MAFDSRAVAPAPQITAPALHGQVRYDPVRMHEYAQEMVDDNGLLNEVPEPLRSYFDFEAYARDLFSSGYVFP